MSPQLPSNQVSIPWSLPPLQGSELQRLSSDFSPTQSLPPKAGAGPVQSLSLLSVPPPQVWEHWDQSDQELQEPSTGSVDNLTRYRYRGAQHREYLDVVVAVNLETILQYRKIC